MVLDRGFAANLGALKKLIRAGEYDLVHCHGSMANVMGALLRRSVRVRSSRTTSANASARNFGGVMSERMPMARSARAVPSPTAATRALPNARASRPRASSSAAKYFTVFSLVNSTTS